MDFCKVTHREGKRLHAVVELKLKHPILFIPSASLPYFLGQAVYDVPGLLLWFTLLRQCFLSLIPAQLNPDLS